MTRQRCKSCGGVYEPDQPGGYYHACPPISLPDGRFRERPDKRDENLDDQDPEKPVRPRRVGKGCEPVAAEPVEILPA